MKLSWFPLYNPTYISRFLLFSVITLTYQRGVVLAGEGGDGELQLELVQIIFRHGDRNPIDPYPKDPYKNESYWPEGFSQLTKRGKQQHFALGKYFRRRYASYLSPHYSPYEIHVQSSDVDRTLMSAAVNLAGLFPPMDNISIWDEELLWQPIPVHTVPQNFDNKLKMSATCPRLKKLTDEWNQGPEMSQIYQEHKELFQYLSNHSGQEVKTLRDLDYLHDTLFIESCHNYSLPGWTDSVFPGGQFYNLTALSFRVPTWTEELKRLKAGPLVKELLEHFQGRVGGTLDKRMKMYLYSGHDTTVASLLNSLGLWNGLPPPYASSVILELRRNISSGIFYLQMFYRNDSAQNPYPLTFPSSTPGLCTFQEFVEAVKGIVPADWGAECRIGFMGMEGISLAALLLAMFLLIVLLVSVFAMALARGGTRQQQQQQQQQGRLIPSSYPYLHLQQTEDEDA